MYINCLELFKDDDKNMMKFVILLVESGTFYRWDRLELVEGGNIY